MSKKNFIQNTLILTTANLITRFIGFYYRIFLSHSIGAEGLGIYQLVLPVQTLVLAVTTSGIQLAITRLCAAKFATGKPEEARSYFFAGSFFSFFLTCLLSFLLYQHADFFAQEIIRETRTRNLICLLSFSLPLSSLHNCISSYYFSRKKASFPSFLLLLEQIARTFSSYLLYQIYVSEGREVTGEIAMGGALFGEIVAVLVGLLFLGMQLHSCPVSLKLKKEIPQNLFSMAFPLSLNRILLTLLGSMEAFLIPRQLQLFGMTSSQALSAFGIFTGMAMPLLLFPATLVISVSSLLMPSIAELQALGQKKRIQHVIRTSSLLTFLLGFFCCIAFIFFGNYAGNLLFHNQEAGSYIRSMAFLCPFLYLHTMLSGILQGLGKSGTCLIHNLIGAALRLFCVLYLVPRLGIRGYLYGMLVCEFFLTLLHLNHIRSLPLSK